MTYYHYYRCGCINWPTRWIEERSDSAAPGYHRKQHFELDKRAKCQRYLRFSHSEQVEQNNRARLRIDDPGTGVTLILKDARVKKGPTIAVMWDPETAAWYHGSCGHGLSRIQNVLPPGIQNYINGLEVAADDWAFGWNCAEVECVVKAYARGRTRSDLTGCYFIAYSVARPQGIYGACRTCSNWIKHFGGEFLQPKR